MPLLFDVKNGARLIDFNVLFISRFDVCTAVAMAATGVVAVAMGLQCVIAVCMSAAGIAAVRMANL